jgi:hypothetical protein
MAFPLNPDNGQQATVNGLIYVYNSTIGAWTIATQAQSIDLTVASIGASGNVTGSSGVFTTLTGTVSTSAQPNITSIGTLSSLSVTGATTANTAVLNTSLSVGGAALSSTVGEIRATNSITSFYSDERLKTNTRRIENALDKIDQLTGMIYTQNKLAEQFGYIDYSEQVGLSAQKLHCVLQQAVKPAPFDIDENGNSISGENYLTVQYERVVPLLVEGIKDLRKELAEIKRLIYDASNSK